MKPPRILSKGEALYKASRYISSVLTCKKNVFIDFDTLYGKGVLFPGLTREEVKEIFEEIENKKAGH